MMKSLVLLLTVLSLICFAADSDVSGVWRYKMTTPDGQVVEADMNLKAEGGKLTGNIDGGSWKLELMDGTVQDDKLAFLLKRERQSGGTLTYKMRASVEGGKKMTGVAESEMDGQNVTMDWSAERK